MLWGTDSIWYGSPQDQIQAFRTFQISPELRAKHGYPEITPALRAKIFGLNATSIYPVSPEVLRKLTGARPHRAGAPRLPRAPRAALPHLRAEDAAGISQPAALERRLARVTG